MIVDAPSEESFESIFVARQPIFDERQDVWGYELLFRATADARGANVSDADMATAKVIADGFVLASEGMSAGQRALINFPQNLIIEQFAYALPSDIAVIEILEDVRPEPEVLEALQGLKESGYMLAMDDFMGEPELMPFVELADILKVDILGILGPEGVANADRLHTVMSNLGSTSCRLLAEKVEDNDVFKLCKELGFTLFQGYFFAKPEIIPGKKISSNDIAKLQLLKELGAPDFDVDRLAKIIQQDPSISYRLFRYINSAGMGVSQKVASVTRAITLLGQRQLSQWLRVIIMSDLAPSKRGQEVAFLSVHRGRFLELMAQQCPSAHKPETLFLIGLFSLLDAMLGQSMEEILEHLSLAKDVELTLMGGESDFRFCLDLVKSYELGDWEAIERIIAPHGMTQPQADPLYTEAMAWTQKIFDSCHGEDCT
ncbi:MAG: HDOD domain-containing protein [Proteobacteria bacterium]|nr:HDOD domain-containing protein [Pseudomonadota bacterium]